jgi:predicted ATPase/class 3 adenylate cyclase/DNA-binding CsgD family transcriptional regulator
MGVQAQIGSALPTGVVTFLLTDVEDSTRLWQVAPQAMAAAIDRHYALLGEAIEGHGGARPVEQGEGDSVVGAFAHASDALAAAFDAQRALRAERWPAGAELRVRVALHSGEARLRGESNYAGSSVIRCARLRALCPGGQIVLSGAARELVRDALPSGATLADLGERALKGFERPERVYALVHPELGDSWVLPSPPNNLPSALTGFVGREREVAELAAAIGIARLVTVIGPGGAGKTRLALRVAADCAESFTGGVWWVELSPLRDGVIEALAGGLGVRPLPGRTPLQAVISRLGEDRALVVLDNCEHVITAAADLAEALIRGCPHVAVMATSRERLRVPGESEWLVPSLSLPAAAEVEIPEVVARSDAGSLFVERVARVRPDFSLSDANAAAVARICYELDGMPLAIELAAARMRTLSVEQIAAGLDDRFRVLTGGPRAAVPRQQTLRGSMDWSYDLLSDEERVLLRRLAVFVGGWSLDAVEDVCTGDGMERRAVLDLLTALVDKSLVQVEQHERAARYRMLETVRQYAAGRLWESGEMPFLRDRHLGFFLAVAERAASELDVPRNLEWLDFLEPDAANFDAAISHGIETDPERALRMSVALEAWWEVSGRFVGGETALRRALEASDESPSPLRARALWSCGQFARYRGSNDAADELNHEALAIAEAIGDESTLARALHTRGTLQFMRDPAGSRGDLSRAFELARSAGDAWALMSATSRLAWSYAQTGDYVDAESVFDEARPAMERVGVTGGAWAPLPLAFCALVRAEYDRCVELNEQAVLAAREFGDPVNEAFAHVLIARVETFQGRNEAALARTFEAEARAAAAGAAIALPDIRMAQGWAHAALGRLDRARELLEVVVAGEAYSVWSLTWAVLTLGDVLRACGDADGASVRAHAAIELSEHLGARSATADAAHQLLAQLAVGRGEWSEAERLAHNTLTQRVELRVRMGLPEILDVLAQVAAGLESFTEAARLLGAAERARSELAVMRWPPDAPTFRELEQRLERHLGSEAYDAARSEGTAMSLEEAIGWVRRARGSRKRPSGGWEALTPTELRVVELVSAGLNNPQVAERMFISRATVKAHLAHIFQKLDLGSRSELAAAAARRAGGSPQV